MSAVDAALPPAAVGAGVSELVAEFSGVEVVQGNELKNLQSLVDCLLEMGTEPIVEAVRKYREERGVEDDMDEEQKEDEEEEEEEE